MYKIFLSVRNRLAITTKCLTALKRNSTIPHQIYVYDNITNYKVEEHFMYFSQLYKKNLITQYVVNTKDSTFNAFSKIVSCNQFGLQHQLDPNKDKCDFLVFLDNDTIVLPGWDSFLKLCWDDINKYKMNKVKVVSQLPGSIMSRKKIPQKIGGYETEVGKFGGSELWCVKNNFFEDIGYLDIKQAVGLDKKHDQFYWVLLEKKSGGNEYVLGTTNRICIHAGGLAGSLCNTLTKNRQNKDKEELIKFEQQEEKINNMTFDEFYNSILNNQDLLKGF